MDSIAAPTFKFGGKVGAKTSTAIFKKLWCPLFIDVLCFMFFFQVIYTTLYIRFVMGAVLSNDRRFHTMFACLKFTLWKSTNHLWEFVIGLIHVFHMKSLWDTSITKKFLGAKLASTPLFCKQRSFFYIFSLRCLAPFFSC